MFQNRRHKPPWLCSSPRRQSWHQDTVTLVHGPSSPGTLPRHGQGKSQESPRNHEKTKCDSEATCCSRVPPGRWKHRVSRRAGGENRLPYPLLRSAWARLYCPLSLRFSSAVWIWFIFQCSQRADTTMSRLGLSRERPGVYSVSNVCLSPKRHCCKTAMIPLAR